VLRQVSGRGCKPVVRVITPWSRKIIGFRGSGRAEKPEDSGDVLRAAAGCQWGALDSEGDEQPL